MSTPKITGIHHIALKCKGVEEFNKTIRFYKDILGLSVARTWGEGEGIAAMLDTGAGLLEIFANAPDHLEAGAVRHFALAVDDTDLCIELARNEGYEIIMEPKDICIPSEPPYYARIGFCRGPVGEELEFFHVK